MLVPEAEQGAGDGHGLPARSTERRRITPQAARTVPRLLVDRGTARGPASEFAFGSRNGSLGSEGYRRGLCVEVLCEVGEGGVDADPERLGCVLEQPAPGLG